MFCGSAFNGLTSQGRQVCKTWGGSKFVFNVNTKISFVVRWQISSVTLKIQRNAIVELVSSVRKMRNVLETHDCMHDILWK